MKTKKLHYGVLGCFAISSMHAQQKKSELPNIIIIFADDLGYGDLSCYGHPTIYTPNLDRMAEEGMKCTQFYVAASVSTPSRAGLLTGRYPYRYNLCTDGGVLFPHAGKGLPAEEITIAEALKQKGYATACIGKWHLGDTIPWMPNDNGFDYYFGLPYSNDMYAGKKDYPPLPLYENRTKIESEPDQRFLTKRYTEKAVSFISKNKNQPFFLYLAHTFPHTPLYASPDFAGKSKRGLYGDVVEELDWSVGEVLKAVKQNKLDTKTLIIFSSDNGPWIWQNLNGGSAGLLRNGKGTSYEGGVRVPGILRWPGVIPPNRVCNEIVSTLDLFPTIMQITGIKMPEGKEYDGVNQLSLLKGETRSARDEYYYYSGNRLMAVRKGPWKLHITVIDVPYGEKAEKLTCEPPHLYHLDRDPSEQFNVVRENPDIVRQLIELADRRAIQQK